MNSGLKFASGKARNRTGCWGDSGGSNSRQYVWVSVGSLPGVSEPSLSFHHDLRAPPLALWRESAGMATFSGEHKKVSADLRREFGKTLSQCHLIDLP